MSTASPNDRTMALNEFFTASEARVDRWRTLNRVAKALAGAGGGRRAAPARTRGRCSPTSRRWKSSAGIPAPG